MEFVSSSAGVPRAEVGAFPNMGTVNEHLGLAVLPGANFHHHLTLSSTPFCCIDKHTIKPKLLHSQFYIASVELVEAARHCSNQPLRG